MTLDRAIALQAMKVHAAFGLEQHWEQHPHIGRNGITPNQHQRVREALRKNTEDALMGMRGLLQSERV